MGLGAVVLPRHLLPRLVAAALATWGIFCAVISVAHRPEFFTRVVGTADPRELAGIRILTAVILLGSVLIEDLAATARLPRAMVRPMGLLGILHALPIGFDRFLASAAALGVFRAVVAAALVAAALGWRTRLAIPTAALGYLLYAGILREYSVFYHTGLVPLYVLGVLACTPCADAWSIDRRRGAPATGSPASYGWARYLCWVVIALPYLASALSKLRNGGVAWWDPTNLRYHFLRATLNPMRFGFESTLALMPAPDVVFQALGFGSLLVELVYPAVLVSRRARLVLPIVMVLFHVSVLFLQNLLFLDLILLQGVVFTGGLLGGTVAETRDADASRRYPLLLAVVATLLLGVWVARLEFYPLSSLQMFSRVNRSGTVEYYRILAERESGAVEPFDLGGCAYRSFALTPVLKAAFNPARREVTREFLAGCAARVSGAERPKRVEVQQWRWDFRREPESPTYGSIAARYDLDVGG